MAKRESMKQYAERRTKEREDKASMKEAGQVAKRAPKDTTKPKGKDSADSKDGGPNGWKKGLTKKSGC